MKGSVLLEVKRLFLQASDLPPAERAAFLAAQEELDPEVRARVEAQLARLDDDGDEALASPGVARFEDNDPDTIGPYRVLRRLGEGGMGVVYLAEQTRPVTRRVAVKRVKAGMDSVAMLRRFEAERQALEVMDHPAIARVLDAGIDADGRPYFAMEYVDGVPLIDFCDRERLDPDARLRLFVDVCRGVQHAHQKGVLHRDLKPSNVLVTAVDGRPLPKIIDFGVAKAVDRHRTGQTVQTQLGVLIGTPEYMSPEQAEPGAVDVDTRSDVYSLGVMLYELLSGELPFSPAYLREQGVAGIQRVLQQEDPPRPSTRVSTVSEHSGQHAQLRRLSPHTLAQRLRGDLDWVTMRALEKDRDRRYGSAGDFAADIERHLRSEPVLAGPPTVGYRARKFLRRYRLQVATAGIVSAALVIGTAVSIWFAVDARELSDELAAARRDVEKENVAVAAVLDRQAADLDRLATGDRTEARMRATIGSAYVALGRHQDGARHLSRAIELLAEIPDAWPDEIFPVIRQAMLIETTGLDFTGEVAFANRRWRAAHDILSAGLPEMQEVLGELQQLRFEDPGHGLYERLFALAGEHYPDGDSRWIALADLVIYQLGGGADRAYVGTEALRIYERMGVPSSDPGLMSARLRLSWHYNYPQIGRFEEAWELQQEMRTAAHRDLPRGHWYTGLVDLESGWSLTRLGRFEEAEPFARAALVCLDAEIGDAGGLTLWAASSLIDWYELQGIERGVEPLRLDLAERIVRADAHHIAVENATRVTASPEVKQILGELDGVCRRPAEARPLVARLVEICDETFEPGDPRLAALARYLSSACETASQNGGAAAWLRDAFQWAYDALLAVDGVNTSVARYWLAHHSYTLGDYERCAAVAANGLSGPSAEHDAGMLAQLSSWAGLARVRSGETQALDLAVEGYRMSAAALGESNGNTNRTFRLMIEQMVRVGQRDRARALIVERHERLQAGVTGARAHWNTAMPAIRSLGDDAVAEEVLQSMTERLPGRMQTAWVAATLHGLHFDREVALQHIARAAVLGNGNAACQNAMAVLYSRLGELDLAIATAERAFELQPVPAWRNNIGVWLLRLGELDRAAAFFEQFAAEHPDYAFAHVNLSDSCRRQGDLDRALAAAELAYSLDRAVGLEDLAMARFERGEDAVDLFLEAVAVARRPYGNGLWPTYAEALARVGRFDEARARLQRLTDEWPTEPHAWSARAWALCRSTGVTAEDRATAIRCAERAVELSNRQGPVMLATLAEAHFQNGDAASAARVIGECTAVMRGRNAEWLTLAEVEQRRQRYLGR